MTSQEKLKILTSLQKLPKNVGDLGKLLLPKALKSCPKSNKSPNLVTLTLSHHASMGLRPIVRSTLISFKKILS